MESSKGPGRLAVHGNHGKKRQAWVAGEAWKPSSVFSNNTPWQITEKRIEMRT
ncbi:hypothetical protein [Paraburkholderia bannensis]|uniref:hypothetical protein n=1 Tax=Paraburkholderia bannensis TaxID=765414 RepID=UPI002AB72D13|nr:hypothetical protein [Paraburkholderia bannensis]